MYIYTCSIAKILLFLSYEKFLVSAKDTVETESYIEEEDDL